MTKTTETMGPYQVFSREIKWESKPFHVEQLQLQKAGLPMEYPYYRLICPDWMNVLPITPDHRAILVRQPRVGVFQYTLETPAGVVEADEMKDPTLTAARELEEETGFTFTQMVGLGSFCPNPALQSNRVHFFLAKGCTPHPKRTQFPDENEDLQIELVPVSQLLEMVQIAEISHALSALCISLAWKHI